MIGDGSERYCQGQGGNGREDLRSGLDPVAPSPAQKAPDEEEGDGQGDDIGEGDEPRQLREEHPEDGVVRGSERLTYADLLGPPGARMKIASPTASPAMLNSEKTLCLAMLRIAVTK